MDKRTLKVPGIYKHFKHVEDGIPNNYIYATMWVAKPLTLDAKLKIEKEMAVYLTESDEIGLIWLSNGQWYHNAKTDENLVIYKSLYDDHIAYARLIDMFLSKVDHNKYPSIKQKFRFELLEGEEYDKIYD